MLPRAALVLIERLAPSEWRESLAGDLAEEQRRRRADGRPTGTLWAVASVLAVSLQLHRERRKDIPIMARPHLPMLDSVGFTLRQALRGLARRPGFALVTVLTLTLGIGATTAVFSLANWLMLRPMPGVTNPDGLVTIQMMFQSGGFYFISVPEMRAVSRAPGLGSVAAGSAQSFHLVIGQDAPIRISGGAVTTNYFEVLGTRIARGRGFTPTEDDPGQASVAIVSDYFWRHWLGADKGVIGRTFTLNGSRFEIVGVAEAGFRGPDRSGDADLWVPLASFRASMPNYPANLLTGTVALFSAVVARREDGATLAQIQDQMRVVQTALAGAYPKSLKFRNAKLVARAGPEVPAWQRDGLRQMFALLLTVVGLLLVLTCANVANLLFARVHERAAELATRQALGASRGRIVRQLLLEGLFLSLAGGLLALVAARLMGSWINGLVIAKNLPPLSAVGLDWRVFAFASSLSLLTCVVASLLPALLGSRVDLIAVLKETARGQSSGGRRVRRLLTVVQIGVAVALLAIGTLLVRSMLSRYHVPLGYDSSRVIAFSVDTSTQGYSDERTRQFYVAALDTLRRLPGVSFAGYAWIEPFRPIGGRLSLKPIDVPNAQEVAGDVNSISDGFLPALGVHFVAGHDFTSREALGAPDQGDGVVIVNETMARRLFGATDVVGRVVEASYPEGTRATIVGVVADIRTRDISYGPVGPTVYQALARGFSGGWGTLHVCFDGRPTTMIPRIREAMRTVDPQLPIFDVERLSDAVDRQLAEPRLLSGTISAFALIATSVAGLGLYGVLARGVAERTREFSIRAALGAGPLMVARLVTGEALSVTAAGGAVGLTGAWLLGRAIETRLFGVEPLDPISFGAAFAVAVVVAVVAALAPTRRAARLDVVAELK
jgi:putative ABC transport system permease protein